MRRTLRRQKARELPLASAFVVHYDTPVRRRGLLPDGARKFASEVTPMTRKLGMAVVAILLAIAAARPARSGAGYELPDISSASDIPYPINVARPGLVALLVNLDRSGSVQHVDVLQDQPSLTRVASGAVQTWSFTAASLDGQPIASALPVAVVFNLFNPAGAANLSRSISIFAAAPATTAGYTPPQITAASYATYPVNSVASGAVVLDVELTKAGSIEKVHVVRAVPALTPQAIAAVKAWTFTPATFHGRPTASRMVVAFVFPTPGTGSF
ncbi:MAG: energy transducer TonB [Candidatus Acidiferrales bacterium]